MAFVTHQDTFRCQCWLIEVQSFVQGLSLKSTYVKDGKGGMYRDCPQMLLASIQKLSQRTVAAAEIQSCYMEPDEQASIYLLLAEAIYLHYRYIALCIFACQCSAQNKIKWCLLQSLEAKLKMLFFRRNDFPRGLQSAASVGQLSLTKAMLSRMSLEISKECNTEICPHAGLMTPLSSGLGLLRRG